MVQLAALPFLAHFVALQDPRQTAKVLYSLPELLLLLLCGTVAGANDFVELALWGSEHLLFLRRFLPFARGIPSHDTLCEVVAALDPALFKTCFTNWVERLRDSGPETIAVDGKTSRRSHARSKGRGPLHTVSAWATGQRLVLGQKAVSEKSNEITAIPLLLQRLELGSFTQRYVKRHGHTRKALESAVYAGFRPPIFACDFRTIFGGDHRAVFWRVLTGAG